MTEVPTAEPVRWLEDPSISAALRADLAHGSSAGAAGIDYGAGLAGLRSAISAQTGVLAPAAAAGTSVGFKAVVGGLAIGALASLWALRDDAVSPSQRTPAPSVAASELPDTPSVPAPAVERVVSGPTPMRSAVAPGPDQRPAVEAALPPIEASQIATPELATPESEPAKPSPRSRVPESDSDRYLREAQLVALARKQVVSSPKQALASTRKHEREFPRGVLVEERRAIEVHALAQLGRVDEARAKAAAFLSDFGDGPHAGSVRRAIAFDGEQP